MALRQKRKPIVRHASKDMPCNREQVGFLQWNRNPLQDGCKYPVPRGDGDLFFLDALPLLLLVALQLLR